jgi:hypothetical protein
MFKPFTIIVLMASALAMAIPMVAQAAASSATATPSPPAPPPKAPWRGPLAPPPITDVSLAYEFRTQLSGNPECQRFATEADGIFLNGALDDAQKVAKLKALGGEAKASGCLTPATAY